MFRFSLPKQNYCWFCLFKENQLINKVDHTKSKESCLQMSMRRVATTPRFPTLSVTRLCSMGELFLSVSTPIASVSNLKK